MTEFDKIYNLYFKDVYLYILSLSRNAQLAEEVTQETFFKALKKIDGFKGDCQLRVWLCQIAKNTYYTHMKKEMRMINGVAKRSLVETEVEGDFLQKTEAFTIHQAVHLLEEPYKEVFSLRVFGELSFGKIGIIFGKTESWARVTFYRAKKKVQEMIKEEKYEKI